MFTTNRDTLRQQYFLSWQKYNNKEVLSDLEKQIITVIGNHPEYHHLLENEEKTIQKDYLPELGETNPFLHLSMHLAIQEQLNTQRPVGINKIYQKLIENYGIHETEHLMMDCLAEAIWQAQKNNTPPNEFVYLTCLNNIKRKS